MNVFQDIFQPVSEAEVKRRAELARLEEYVSVKRCGSCDHWMKSTCKLEQRSGRKMSMNDYGCAQYELSLWEVEQLKELRKVLV